MKNNISERLNVFKDIKNLKNPYIDKNYITVIDDRIFYSIREKTTIFNNVKYTHNIEELSYSIIFDKEDIITALDIFSMYKDTIDYAYVRALPQNYIYGVGVDFKAFDIVRSLSINDKNILADFIELLKTVKKKLPYIESLYDAKKKEIKSLHNISNLEKSILINNLDNILVFDIEIYSDFYRKIKKNLKNTNNIFKISLGLVGEYNEKDVSVLFGSINYLSFTEIYNYSSIELPKVSDLKFNKKSEELMLNCEFNKFEEYYYKIYHNIRNGYLDKIK